MESRLLCPSSSSNSKRHSNQLPLVEARMTRSWADLPIDLIPTIATKASTTNKQYVCLRAVCMTWRKLLPPNPPHLAPHVVWFMLPRFPQDLCQKLGISDSDISFYDISQCKTHRLQLPYMSGKYCCGSSYGWLVLEHEHNMSLFNPITRKSINLPSLDAPPTLLKQVTRSEAGSSSSLPSSQPEEYTTCVLKASLSSSPSKPGCIVVALFLSSSDWELGFCRIGDSHWRGLRKQDPSSRLMDFTFHNKLVYTADIINDISVYDLQDLSMRKFTSQINFYNGVHDQINLVEGDANSGGPLVIRTIQHHGKNSFVVYKCSDEQKILRQVKEIGNRVLFLNAKFSVNLQCCEKQGLVYYDVRQPMSTDTFCFTIKRVDLQTKRLVRFNRSPLEVFPSTLPGLPMWFTPSVI